MAHYTQDGGSKNADSLKSLQSSFNQMSVEQAPGVLPSHSAPGHGKGVENVQTGRDVSLQDRHGSIPSTKDGEGLERVHIAVMGVTGAGKSKFIQLCTESREVKVGHGLRSCTNEVGEHEFVWRNRLISLIDTPGFDDTSRSDRQVLDDIAGWLGSAYSANIQLTGILYLHRITDTRMGGVAFDNLKMFKKLCGPDYYPRVTLTTTRWDDIDERVGEKREAELLSEDDFWRKMKAGGCHIERHYGDRESAMDILRSMLRNKSSKEAPTFVQVQKEMVDDKKGLDETTAGKEVNKKIEEERARFEKELARAKQEMQEAMEEQDLKSAEQYKKQKEEMEAKLRQGFIDQEKLKVTLEDMQRQNIERLEEMERNLAARHAEFEASKAELNKERSKRETLEPGSGEALALDKKIAEREDQTNQASKDLAAQEKAVESKKKKFFVGIYEWAKKNPNAVAKGGMVLAQSASRIISSYRQRRATATADADAWDSASPLQPVMYEYEIEEVDCEAVEGYPVDDHVQSEQEPPAYSPRGSFLEE